MPSTHPISVSLTPELLDALRSLAEHHGSKLSPLIEDLLWRSRAVKSHAKSVGVERTTRAPAGRPRIE